MGGDYERKYGSLIVWKYWTNMTSSKIIPWYSDHVAPAAPSGREYQEGAALVAGKADEGWNKELGGWEEEAFQDRHGVVRVLLDHE